MEYVVVDIGGTKTLFTLISKRLSSFKIIKTKRIITSKSKYFMIDHLRQLDLFLKENNINKFKLRYSVCGPVKNNKIISLPNLGILDLDLKNYIQGFFSKAIDIKVENDVNCFGLGIDRTYKSQIKNDSLFCINIGTGLGGSYINNKRLIVGSQGRFAEIGREIFKGTTRENFFEETLNLIHKLRLSVITRHGLKIDNFKDYLEMINKYNLENNKTISKIDSFFFSSFIDLLDSIISLYDPDYIVIGGSLVYYLEYLLKKTELKQQVRSFYKLRDKLHYINYTTINYNVIGALYIK